ncbi:MAG: ATPase [Gammaproteobacteria bacterium]|nr:ATPase [Gammaproteobacteria bacterium]MCY4227580.1 ATPase [Gammaproteobacteria bacterium]MCY4313035.1 ATPase [Gammaproteobacteria bacterium]
MKMTAKQFMEAPSKVITLLGMSGVGKTAFSLKLPRNSWFHYSGDYRIATRYLDEPILDEVKRVTMQNPYLRHLLQTDSIYIRNNFTFEHQFSVSSFLGMVGDPARGGLSIDEFKRRQAIFRDAENHAMRDVEVFMQKSRDIYGYPHFINDAGGSVCSLTDAECWERLSAISVVVYLHADESLEHVLMDRAISKPKPLCYEDDFLERHLARYLEEHSMQSADQVDPEEFVRWVFPLLIDYRRPQYERIAEKYGYTIEAEKIWGLNDEADIMDLLCQALDGLS